jgi:hypothetical protein
MNAKEFKQREKLDKMGNPIAITEGYVHKVMTSRMCQRQIHKTLRKRWCS